MPRPTFLSLASAYRGLASSQANLDVTANNITNLDTKGYTRQRVDVVSVGAKSKTMRYAYSNQQDLAVGLGAEVDVIRQVRDTHLDQKYRQQASIVGENKATFETLADLEAVLDETNNEYLMSQMADFKEQLQNFSNYPSNKEIEQIVKNSAEMLTFSLNNYANQIDEVYNNTLSSLEDIDMQKVNSILNELANINKTIEEQGIANNPGLELRDERNLLLDELSEYVDIQVNYTSGEEYGYKREDMSITLAGSTVKLLEGNTVEQFSLNKTNSNDLRIELSQNISGNAGNADITDNIKTGVFRSKLNMLGGKGTFAQDPTNPVESFRGIQHYKIMLDVFASELAETFNSIQDVNSTGQKLFQSTTGINDPVTAGTIKISDAWKASDDIYINTTYEPLLNNNGANDNIMRMIHAFESKTQFDKPDGNALSTQTFDDYLINMSGSQLATQTMYAEKSYTNSLIVKDSVDAARESVSGVSLDEETINMLKYNKSYQAAAKLVNVIDEMLQTIINMI